MTREAEQTMTSDEIVLTIEDLPTLRRLVNLTNKIVEGGAAEFSHPQERAKVEMMQLFTSRFMQALVDRLEGGANGTD